MDVESQVAYQEKFSKSTICAVTTAILVFLCEILTKIMQVIVASMIVDQKEYWYTNDWKVQAAAITGIISGVIAIFVEMTMAILVLMTKGEMKIRSAGLSPIVAAAQIFMLVLVYISWKEMWEHEIGQVFCVVIGIIQPCVFVIAIVTMCTLTCIIASRD